MTISTARPPVECAIGLLVLALSAMGYPLTRLAIERLGRRGAVLAEAIAATLLVRDATLVATGTPALLRPAPARLLYLELAAAMASTLSGLRPAVGRGMDGSSEGPTVDTLELARRASLIALFAIHTLRFWVYLQPDRGLKAGSTNEA